MEYMIPVEPGVSVYANDINPSGQKTILFLHGWPGNYELFEYQYNRLCRCGFRCIGLDQRGFGNSDKPFHGYDYNRLADDVRCVIDALDLNDVTLCGHSTGGAIAARYMARYKGYGVGRLVLCAAAAPSLIKRPGFPYGQEAKDIDQMIRSTYADRPAMLRDFGKSFFYQKVSEPFSDWFFQLGLQAASWATVEVEKAWLKEMLFDDLAQIEVPTLILHGVHDQICLYPLADAQNSLIRDSLLIPFENSGHGLFYDEKDKFNYELACFAG
jgi:pimeloyl-ACP methyl ester carboxylesterase